MSKKKFPDPKVQNPRVLMLAEIQVDEGSKCSFIPWSDEENVHFGWKAEPIRSGTTFVYIVPISDPGADQPRFDLYVGKHGDPNRDRRIGPFTLDGDIS